MKRLSRLRVRSGRDRLRLSAAAATGIGLLAAGLVTGLDHASTPPSPRAAPAVPRPVGRVLARGRASRGGARTPLPAARSRAAGPVIVGTASWYGGSFQGRRTASGERFDTGALTAASRTLPFGTGLRVCRLDRCVVVRVNDRGPYVGSRVLDLSHAAARVLGFEGVAHVTATPLAGLVRTSTR